ncbi:SrtB family sortase [Clostridia bacterium]|nr:SrtB family sortase [Clostridia bacterium]
MKYVVRTVILCGIAAIIMYFALGESSEQPKISRIAQTTPQSEVSAPEIPEEKPTSPLKISAEFENLRQEYGNNDIVAVLKIDGTTIDYPVVQYSDNEYYLTRDIYKENNRSGWIFMDYENTLVNIDQNNIIYGHNMKQNIMFHGLRNYANKDFFDKHRYITLKTAYGADTTWEIFSFMDTSIELNYIQVYFEEGEFAALVKEIKARSVYDTGVDANENDKILNLSTCSVKPLEGGRRYVLSAKLLKQ